MEKTKGKFDTIESYIASLPDDTRKAMIELKETLKKAAPEAQEMISYNIPALKQEGMLVYFAGWKDHLSIYPRTAGMEKEFGGELTPYAHSKGTLRFQLSGKLPLDLISRIVRFRVEENKQIAAAKQANKKSKGDSRVRKS